MSAPTLRDERGFTLVELLVASVVTVLVVGGAVALTSQIQNGYRRQIEDSAGEQEGRYALEWINRYLRSAGNNPFNVTTSECPAANTPYAALTMDPNGDGIDNDIALQSDLNPPDKVIGGTAGQCNQTNENVKISFNATDHTITFQDVAVGGSATTRTDAVIDNLHFSYLAADHVTPITNPAHADDVFYVQIQLRIRTRTIDVASGAPTTRTLSSEVRVRSR